MQRICDTTESPEIYRIGPSGTRSRPGMFSVPVALLISSSGQIQLDHTIEVVYQFSLLRGS